MIVVKKKLETNFDKVEIIYWKLKKIYPVVIV